MRLDAGSCLIRSWRPYDVRSLAHHANDRDVWRNLRDRFPHPYTVDDARAWLREACSQQPEVSFALEIDGEACGGVGLTLGTDIHRCGAEIGYWLGQPFWGRGIATAAVQVFSEWALARFQLARLFATVFEGNPASNRVLEKAGYVLEGVMRRSAIKDERILDQYLYALVK